MKIQVHIDKLVVDDPGVRPEVLGPALQKELSRLLTERGLPPGLARGAQLPRLSARMEPTATAGVRGNTRLGRGVAKATLGALQRGPKGGTHER